MASPYRVEDVNMSVTKNAGKRFVPLKIISKPPRQRPSVPEDATQSGNRRPDREVGNKDNRDRKSLSDDTSPKNWDSIQTGGAQQHPTSSIISMQTVTIPWGKTYEIKTDDVGNDWFHADDLKKLTIYHSDIRYELDHYSEQFVPRSGRHFESMLGARTDDKTSYHPRFDFCGQERADRPDCLFYIYKPVDRHAQEPTQYLVWKEKVVLDYKRRPIRALHLPLIISSLIGKKEPARLEAMHRFDIRVEWDDVLARILRKGVTSTQASRFSNQLRMSLSRFRILARLLSISPKGDCQARRDYHLSTMSAEMVAKNTTKGLFDMKQNSEEHAFVELLNLGNKKTKQKPQSDKDPSKAHPKTDEEREKKRKEKRGNRRRWRIATRAKLNRAGAWAQVQTGREAKNQTPTPSIYGPLKCTTIESIVAFKLASMSQHRRDGSLAFERGYMLENAAPQYDFEDRGMCAFFGGPAHFADNAEVAANDPYGLLGNPTVTRAQSCLVDVLLEPARMQYRKLTLVNDGSGEYRPIFITNPKDSYWQQLKALQGAFERDWLELGCIGHPPVLYGLLKLDYNTMTWNSDCLPILSLVSQAIDSASRTHAAWKRQLAETQRAKLRQKQRRFEDEKTDEEEGDEIDKADVVMANDRKGGEDDVVMAEGGEAEEDTAEDEMEKGEEL